MSDLQNVKSSEMLVARQASKQSIVFGAVLTVLGIFAVLAPMFTGVAVTALVGMLLLAAGFVEVIFAFQADSFGKGVLRFLFGGLGVLAGMVVIATPVASLGVLTLVLAAFFLASGGIDVVLALKLRPKDGSGWMLFSGIVSIALGVLIALQMPVSGLWAVGLYVGVRLLMHGWVLMALGRTGQESLTHLQDTRIEMLERHVRAGAQILQETQAVLVDHTTMLLALDNELRKKVSTSEVDPAIQELNKDLGEARKQMQVAAAATKETWDTTQQEANAAFEKLRIGAAEVTKRLKQELGLDDHQQDSES
jgi:uncharacterized membrane protein HdeD (DUF308 family)